MWFIIARKEFQAAWRDKLLHGLAVITWLLLLVAVVGGYERYQYTAKQKATADQRFRQEWEEQEANPHSAAHFGTWLFKPFTFLTLYDNGLNNYTGLSYRVEAHKQHEVNYSTMQDTDSQLRFGELTPALVFRLLIPLLIIVIAFGAIGRERDNNTLRMILVQGGSNRSLLWGKVLGNYAIILAILLPVLLALIAGVWLFHQQALLPRILLLTGSYGLYFFVITALTVLVSAWCRRPAASLLVSLGAWTLCCVLLPRMIAGWADQAAPLPSRHAFNRKIQEGYAKGLGTDGSALERRKKYEQQVLQKYGVDSITQLPVNFDGLTMQYGEDYTSKVYRLVAGETDSIIRRQQQYVETASLINPFLAMQQVSMGLAGSDYYHHLSFHHQAQQYRDSLIRTLNMELAQNGGSYGNYDYKVGPAYFKQIPHFRYSLPATTAAVGWHGMAWLSLAGWTLLVILLIPFTAAKLR